MKLALGTVQFGLNYGVANQTGQVSALEVVGILETALNAGIKVLDTAISYGESEACLGRAGVEGFKVVTKLPALEGTPNIAGMVERSLERLAVPRLHGLLLHRSSDLAGANGSWLHDALLDLKQRRLVEKIGVSIYDPRELETILDRFEMDIVQSPYNVFDRRLVSSGWLGRLKDAGVEVHTRSTFLQGLLLMDRAQRPEKFARWNELWTRWDGWLEQAGTSAIAASLGFVCDNDAIDHVLVGVDGRTQLAEIIKALQARPPQVPDWVASDDLDLINPVNWNSL